MIISHGCKSRIWWLLKRHELDDVPGIQVSGSQWYFCGKKLFDYDNIFFYGKKGINICNRKTEKDREKKDSDLLKY